MNKSLGVLGLWLVLLGAAPAAAEEGADDASRAAARDMGYSGVEAFQRGDYPTALDKLGRAYRILKVPTLGLWLARALEKSGKLVEAAERYMEVTRLEVSGSDAAVHRKAQGEAESERKALLVRIPALVLSVADGNEAELQVSIDGASISNAFLGEKRLVNPGKHDVSASRGSQRFASVVTVQESEVKAISIDFSASPGSAPTAPSGPATAGAAQPSAAAEAPSASSGGSKTLAWTSIAIGGVGLAVGGVTGFMAMSKRNSLDCPDDSCTADKQDDVDSYNALRTVSTVGFVAGAVFAAAGGVLLLTGSGGEKESARAHVSPFIGVGRAGVGGRF
jgi:hypothetical protein